jgi:hypothetical protein
MTPSAITATAAAIGMMSTVSNGTHHVHGPHCNHDHEEALKAEHVYMPFDQLLHFAHSHGIHVRGDTIPRRLRDYAKRIGLEPSPTDKETIDKAAEKRKRKNTKRLKVTIGCNTRVVGLAALVPPKPVTHPLFGFAHPLFGFLSPQDHAKRIVWMLAQGIKIDKDHADAAIKSETHQLRRGLGVAKSHPKEAAWTAFEQWRDQQAA